MKKKTVLRSFGVSLTFSRGHWKSKLQSRGHINLSGSRTQFRGHFRSHQSFGSYLGSETRSWGDLGSNLFLM